jgi:hypothetical protein
MTNPAKIIQSLRPGANYCCNGTEYEGLEWFEPPVYVGGQKKPTKKEWDDECKRQEKLAELNKYKIQRMLEYPDIADYLDGLVKGDRDQIQAYIDACVAVKAKYPKPSELEEL